MKDSFDVELARFGARLELARRHLYDYCLLQYPGFYKPNRTFLKDICNQIEGFVKHSPKRFLILNAPPRHGKSLTAQSATAWLLGDNPANRVMTASYNERLASTFSKNVRNIIQTKKAGDKVVYQDIFPNVAVQYGDASAQMWTIEGQNQTSYLATSPNGTATGFGCDFLICDDLIKNAVEAYNTNVLDDIWSWFTDTMLSRLEGQRKVIVIMTRWAKGDLAGRILEAFPDEVELITYQACNDQGAMLCDDILNTKDYEFLKREMSLDIFEANYNQKPIDIKGRLYSEFKEWEKKPEGEVKNYTDTADTGSDFLCSISYTVFENEAYITDLVFTDEPMEITEEATADLLYRSEVNRANVESNNGGRGFARNVERILREKHGSNRTIITPVPQTKNKESRILASSAWVQNHVYMPPNWKTRWPEFYKQVMEYQRKGKNAHDDAADVLAAIFEEITGKRKPQIINNIDNPTKRRHRRTFER